VRFLGLTSLFAIVAASGCSSSSPLQTSPSSLQGEITQSTFPSQAHSVQVSGTSGGVVETQVDAVTGKFTVQVSGHDHYRIAVITGNGPVAVVFPRASGRVDGAFSMESGGIRVDLGAIRYLSSGRSVQTATGAGSCPTDGGADGTLCSEDGVAQQCVDGTPAGAASLCNDLDLPLGYGQATSVLATGGPYAIPSQSPACRVGGCDPQPDDSTQPIFYY
jgi:hypothetical protein